jgi:hypothetical protein
MNRDEVILEVLGHARRMISNYAFAYDLDKDDLTQELACKLLEVWDKAACKEHVRPYLYGAIRNQLLKMVPHEERPLRLEDVETTLTLDVYCGKDQMDIVVQAVHRTLRKCSAKVQAYAVKAYGMTDYEPDRELPQAKSGCVRTRSLRETFSKDERILALIGC